MFALLCFESVASVPECTFSRSTGEPRASWGRWIPLRSRAREVADRARTDWSSNLACQRPDERAARLGTDIGLRTI